jgi:hypothetical protein
VDGSRRLKSFINDTQGSLDLSEMLLEDLEHTGGILSRCKATSESERVEASKAGWYARNWCDGKTETLGDAG